MLKVPYEFLVRELSDSSRGWSKLRICRFPFISELCVCVFQASSLAAARRMAGKKGAAVALQTEVGTEEEWQKLLEKEGLVGTMRYSFFNLIYHNKGQNILSANY